MKPAALITSIFLSLIAAAHVLRIALGTGVTVGDFAIPMWASGVAVAGAGRARPTARTA